MRHACIAFPTTTDMQVHHRVPVHLQHPMLSSLLAQNKSAGSAVAARCVDTYTLCRVCPQQCSICSKHLSTSCCYGTMPQHWLTHSYCAADTRDPAASGVQPSNKKPKLHNSTKASRPTVKLPSNDASSHTAEACPDLSNAPTHGPEEPLLLDYTEPNAGAKSPQLTCMGFEASLHMCIGQAKSTEECQPALVGNDCNAMFVCARSQCSQLAKLHMLHSHSCLCNHCAVHVGPHEQQMHMMHLSCQTSRNRNFTLGLYTSMQCCLLQCCSEQLLYRSGAATVCLSVPATINMYLRDYQRDGVRFLFRQFAQHQGGILGDDMVLYVSI